MNKIAMSMAMEEAEEFLGRANDVQERVVIAGEDGWRIWQGSPETAALKRKSMDLTRALAAMRKP